MVKISKRFGAVILALCMILTIMPVISFADDDAAADVIGSEFTLNGNCLENAYLSVCVNEDGRFTIGTTGGNPDLDTDNNKKMLYGWPGSGTTHTTIVVDDNITTFYDETEVIFDTENGSVTTSHTYNGVKFTMILTIVLNAATNRYDTVEISYIAENTDAVEHQVGVRIMLDTMLGSNDSAPFRVSGYGDITTQTEFTGENIPPYWQVFNSLTDPSVIAQGSFLINRNNLPDTVHFTNWAYVSNTIWNDVVSEGSSNGDSAVTVQWNQKALASGESRTYTTHYGLSEVEIAASENLSLGVTGDSILNVVGNAYSPNPVSYNAYITNTGNADASNVTVSLALQENSLFSFADGETATRTIDTIAAGSNAQETFVLNVANSYEEVTETLTFTLTDSNGETITITKEVTIPALAGIILDDSRRVLLIQDNLPWDSFANTTVLDALNVDYSVTTTAEFSASMLADYGVVILANDQTTDTYNEYTSFTTELENFAVNGGTVIYGACHGGWAGGALNDEIIGGIYQYRHSDNYNYVADEDHPIVTGELTDGIALVDADLYSNYCSHIYFDEATLPVGTRVVLRSSYNDAPTLITYPMGAGMIIASGLTWEHNYVQHTGNDSYGSFALRAMDDYFSYAINYYNESTDNRIDDANLNISAELDIDVVENDYNPNPIEYTIFIANPGEVATGEISFNVEFEENSLLELVNAELPHNFGVINAGETKDHTIQIYINPTLEAKTEVIKFNFTSTSGETVTIEKEINIPAVEYICDHIWDEGVITVPANCSEEGLKVYTCTNGCGCTYEEVIPVNADAHVWDEGTVTVPYTCLEDGLKVYACEVCDATYEEVITTPGHDWGEGIVSVEPTCLANGLKMFICATCGETNSEVLIKLDHELEHVYEAPSCTVDGVEYDICLLCINTFNYNVIPAIGHAWGEGEVISVGDCITEGITKYTCANCNETYEERTPVAGHQFGPWAFVTVPTYRAGGSSARTCTVCNFVETRDVERVIPDIVKSDDATGVEIGFMNNTYGSDIEFNVSNIFDGESYHFLNLERGNFNYELYDITTTIEGEKVQPTGSVLVKLPIPEDYSRDNLAIYYVTNTGTLERLEMWIEGDYACFEAEHFSAYTLVDESEEVLMFGDVTLDKNLSPADARLALRQAAGLESYAPGSLEFRACDVDFDGVVAPADARNILRKASGLEANF